MKKLLTLACLLVCLQVGEGMAAARELKQSELRKATNSGDAIRLKKVIEGVEKTFGGTPVDARAFQTDQVYYRILVKKPNGKIISVIVNAQTGTVVPNRSQVGRQISEAARTSPGQAADAGARGKSGTRGNSSNNGNAGGNGNGGGNSGGNGNGGGNSGGNGGGNSGGNGGGNSGGNGGGKGGGKK